MARPPAACPAAAGLEDGRPRCKAEIIARATALLEDVSPRARPRAGPGGPADPGAARRDARAVADLPVDYPGWPDLRTEPTRYPI